MAENLINWYYAIDGKQLGPVDRQSVKYLVGSGVIKQDTKVWSVGGSWKSANETDLSSLFFQGACSTPPPLVDLDAVDNKLIWFLFFLPVIQSVIELTTNKNLMWIFIMLSFILLVLDRQKLKKAGVSTPSALWILIFPPVYLWKRAGIFNQKKVYFAVWLSAAILSAAVDFGGNRMILEDSACSLVTDIVKTQLYGTARCRGVSVTSEVADGFYKGTATLDNGTELTITIEEKGNDMIYVQIPKQ